MKNWDWLVFTVFFTLFLVVSLGSDNAHYGIGVISQSVLFAGVFTWLIFKWKGENAEDFEAQKNY